MHAAASNEAPPYFERASFELNVAAQAPNTRNLKKAALGLDTDLEYSAAAAYAFGERDAESIFSEEATDSDYKYLGKKAPKDPEGRAELYAKHVWGDFGSTTINTAEPAPARTQVKGNKDGE
jgi:hypothetical protein